MTTPDPTPPSQPAILTAEQASEFYTPEDVPGCPPLNAAATNRLLDSHEALRAERDRLAEDGKLADLSCESLYEHLRQRDSRIAALEAERDRLRDDLAEEEANIRAGAAAVAVYERRIAALEADCDPPVCRLQFPDGSVPGNAREAADGWRQHYDAIARTLAIVSEDRAKLLARVGELEARGT